MTVKAFWQDPYATSLSTTVTAVEGAQVWVAQTIFFAFSGGQESDAGTFNQYPVLAAEKNGMDIVYTLAADQRLQAGEAVDIQIDWQRRYRLMRLHFAAEMVLQLVLKQQPDIQRIGAHISADKARIDFAREQNISELFPAIEQAVAALVAADFPIECKFSDEPKQHRYWQVEGFATMACGGTHVRTTGEVGPLALKRKNTGKGKERIEVTLLT